MFSISHAEVYKLGSRMYGRVHLNLSDLVEPIILDGWTLRRQSDGRVLVYSPVIHAADNTIRVVYVADELYRPIRDALLAVVPA